MPKIKHYTHFKANLVRYQNRILKQNATFPVTSKYNNESYIHCDTSQFCTQVTWSLNSAIWMSSTWNRFKKSAKIFGHFPIEVTRSLQWKPQDFLLQIHFFKDSFIFFKKNIVLSDYVRITSAIIKERMGMINYLFIYLYSIIFYLKSSYLLYNYLLSNEPDF